MLHLSSHQRAILDRVTAALEPVQGVRCLVLGGSHARGLARPDSDLDVGIYYAAGAPLDVEAVRQAAAALHDEAHPQVSDLYGWGPWMNGGAWLTVEGQRVDLIYRSLDDVGRILAEAKAGRYVIDLEQQPPFGFFSPIILGELAIAKPLTPPDAAFLDLQAQVSPMPQALVRSVVQDRLWQVEFGLTMFAPKFISADSAYGFAGCMTRFAYNLVLAVFALNRSYALSDKTALMEAGQLALVPPRFAERIEAVLGGTGHDRAGMERARAAVADLFQEVRALAGDLYAPPWRL